MNFKKRILKTNLTMLAVIKNGEVVQLVRNWVP